MSGEYLRQMSDDRFYELGVHALRKAAVNTQRYSLAYVKSALDTCKGKLKTFAELPPYAGFYFTEQVSYDPEAARKDFTPENRPRLARLREALGALAEFSAASLEASLKTAAAELGVKAGVLVHPVRLACTGKTIGPSLYHLMEVLGKDRCLERLDRALALIA
jgi:glutamyl-tRNA synthetase